LRESRPGQRLLLPHRAKDNVPASVSVREDRAATEDHEYAQNATKRRCSGMRQSAREGNARSDECESGAQIGEVRALSQLRPRTWCLIFAR